MYKPDPIRMILRQETDHAAKRNLQNATTSSRQKEWNRHNGRGLSRLWFLGIGGLAIVLGWTMPVRSFGNVNGENDQKTPANAVAAVVIRISIRDIQFFPAAVEVKKGDVIEWQNDDLVPHTATSASFDSGTILAGQSWRHTFTDVGNVPYACTFHPQMKGLLTIK